MYCKQCGNLLPDNAVACEKCGLPVSTAVKSPVQPTYQPQPTNNDSGSIGWWFLGFFFPLVGLILFLLWKDSKPRCAKKAGIGALVGFVAGFVLGIILGILLVTVFTNLVFSVVDDVETYGDSYGWEDAYGYYENYSDSSDDFPFDW